MTSWQVLRTDGVVNPVRLLLTNQNFRVKNMLAKRVRATPVAAAIALFGALSGVGSAQAAVYTGSWDPAYGGPFGSLGWKASASFDVPGSCLSQGNGSYEATGLCGGFSVLSAQLFFYDIAAPATILESFDLNTNVFANGLDIAGNQLVGINTGFFGAVVPTGDSKPIAGGGAYSFSLILYNSTFAQLVYTKPTTASPLCTPFLGSSSECGYSANAAVGTITPAVPEPQTYALMLAGLGAIGWFARRRSQKAA